MNSLAFKPAQGGVCQRSATRKSAACLVQRSAFLPTQQQRWVAARAEGQPGPKPTTQEADEPVWVRREREREMQAGAPAAFPWPLALLGSVIVAIAATGSIFEYLDRNAIFGVVQPDNPVWAPILLFMAVTGYPVAGFLFKYGVDKFNEEAERQDRLDGYLPEDRR